MVDSHALVWWLEDDKRLSARAREAIESENNPAFFSSASLWELAIKQAKGKLKLPAAFLDTLILEGVAEILIGSRHALEAAALPPHHDDPFDRMIVAQARLEGLIVVTRDARIAAYDVPVLW